MSECYGSVVRIILLNQHMAGKLKNSNGMKDLSNGTAVIYFSPPTISSAHLAAKKVKTQPAVMAVIKMAAVRLTRFRSLLFTMGGIVYEATSG